MRARLRPLTEAAHRLRPCPGWSLRINLFGTPLADVPFAKLEQHRSEDDWLVCWVEDRAFNAWDGPENLAELFEVFLAWSDAGAGAR